MQNDSNSPKKQKPYNQQTSQKIQLPSFVARKSSNSNACDICFQIYHILGRWPMQACPNNHFFCDHCIDGMFRYSDGEPCPCPICRVLIKKNSVKPHYELFRLINKQSTIKQALGQEKKELFLFAFQYQIFEIAKLFKEGRMNQLQKLAHVDASRRNIKQIQHFECLSNLSKLRMERNLISQVISLQTIKNLKILNLSHNRIINIDPLGKLINLVTLAVEFNLIERIDSVMQFKNLKHWFIIGNPLQSKVGDDLLQMQFKQIITLSFSIRQNQTNKQMQMMNWLNSLIELGKGGLRCFPKLNKLILQKCLSQVQIEQFDLLFKLKRSQLQVQWLSFKQQSIKEHQNWMQLFINERNLYGQIFGFIPDNENPFKKDYAFNGPSIKKITSNFTSINSSHSIPRQGKQSLKFKIIQPSQHFVIGMCNAFLKHNSNVYSEHFVGLTFWGAIYTRGEYSAVTGKLRLEDKPIIRMCVDFDLQMVFWYSEQQQIGKVAIPIQFKHSQLYFLIGMRDVDTQIKLLEE